MQFARVVDAYEKIEATTKRLEMTELLVGLLRETPKEDLDKVVYLTQGRIHPDYEGIELGLAEKMVMRVLAHATGMDDARIGRLWKEKGDLGLVAQEAIAARRQKPLESTPLTTAKVYQLLDAIARESGEGSQERKIRLLSDLLGNATPREAKYIVRMVVGQMRLGVADMTIVDALAAAFATKADRPRVERAYNVCSDLGEVARVLASKGMDGLQDIHLKLFRPIRAMLAERLETLEEIFERMGKAALEYKYDGLRVQAHVSPKRIELFSRHLENITVQFPEIVDGLRSAIQDRAAIVEGEAVPVDPNTGEFLPFQEVSRRRGRKTEVERMAREFPVTLFAFDCLLHSEEDYTARPYVERRKALEAVVKPNDGIRHSTVRITEDVKQAEAFFDEALQAGCEGLMAKALDSTYDAGARGFKWIKFKKEYSAALSDTIDLVVEIEGDGAPDAPGASGNDGDGGVHRGVSCSSGFWKATSSESGAQVTRLRPCDLDLYNASSAAWINSATVVAWTGQEATPTLIVTRSGATGASFRSVSPATATRRRSATATAPTLSVRGSTTTNSSPP